MREGNDFNDGLDGGREVADGHIDTGQKAEESADDRADRDKGRHALDEDRDKKDDGAIGERDEENQSQNLHSLDEIENMAIAYEHV